MPTFYLIDAHAYLHRAYHALPPLTNPKGEPVNAVYGFMRMTFKILKTYKPDYIAVCFDTAAPTFRHVQYEAYKATRKETDSTLVSQFPKAYQAIVDMGLAHFKLDGFEADDLIAQLARDGKARGWDVVIVSGDKDVLQLVDDKVKVLNEPKDTLYDAAQVEARYGVPPQKIPDIFSLMGDSSDNVPGVKGIGEKTAVKLIQEHGDLESLLRVAGTIPGKTGSLLLEHAASARMSRELVHLNRDVPITVDWDACKTPDLSSPALAEFLIAQGFRTLLSDMQPGSISVDTSKRAYATLQTEAALTTWLKAASDAEFVAIDVETDSLDARRSGLVGISMAYAPGAACYIPLAHEDLGAAPQLPLATVQRLLNPFFALPSTRLCGHNLKYDWMCLRRHGFEIPKLTFDTMVAAYVLNPSRNGYGLKELSFEKLGEAMTPISELIGKGAKQKSMTAVPIEQAAPYASADADMTLRLALQFSPELKQNRLESLFYEMEMPLIEILGHMEMRGIQVDQEYLRALGQDMLSRLQKLEAEIHALAGGAFNLNSPKQLGEVLFEKLKLPFGRKTKTGYSTDEEVLNNLAALHELPSRLLEYRELQKLQSTDVEGLREAMDPVDRRVHSHFNQTVASTGRLSSSDPNLQNIPIRSEAGKKIRQAFVAKPGHQLLSADYSQIDLRMLAHISSDEVLCAAFRKGEDVHTTTACQIFGITPDQMTPELRRIAKSINFGIAYGISAFGLSQQLGISVEEAKRHIDRYFERYAGVRAWMDNCLAEARQNGCVRTLLGRVRYLPEINAKNPNLRGFGERMALNTPIQGTSADVIKVAMVNLAKAQLSERWPLDMLLQVHDELVFEVPEETLEATARRIKPFMENAVPLKIPVVVDFKVGANWAQMRPLALTPA